MTIAEKAGLFFQTMILPGADGELSEGNPAFGLPSTEEYVQVRAMNHFNLLGAAPEAGVLATWHNRLQTYAASTRLGIPVTLSTDPRHTYSDNPGGSAGGRQLLGLARAARPRSAA